MFGEKAFITFHGRKKKGKNAFQEVSIRSGQSKGKILAVKKKSVSHLLEEKKKRARLTCGTTSLKPKGKSIHKGGRSCQPEKVLYVNTFIF